MIPDIYCHSEVSEEMKMVAHELFTWYCKLGKVKVGKIFLNEYPKDSLYHSQYSIVWHSNEGEFGRIHRVVDDNAEPTDILYRYNTESMRYDRMFVM
jgi:hypothetical protein